MTIKFYCDICDNEIIGQLYALSVEPFDIVSVNMRKHICEKCLKELEDKIESMCENYKKIRRRKMDKVIKIKDANNYVINLKQISTNNENIQILEDAKDYTKCTLNINMVFSAHNNYCHEEEKEIEINSEFIQIKLCDYLKQLLKDWNDRLSTNNKELEVEVDLDDKK